MIKRLKETFCEQCPEGYQSFFHTLDKADLQYINEQKRPHWFKKGELIFEEGKKPQGLYCLREGKVKVFKNSFDGREQITRILFPGELLGLKAVLSGNVYSVSSAALEESVLCFINKTDFFQLMLKYPEFSRAIVILLSKLLEQAEFRMISLAYKPVRERLAETLLFLNHSFHSVAPSYPRTYLNVTRQDIANIIGTAPETVIRFLSEFKESKLIEIKGRKIFLTNIRRLRQIANLPA
ncbi:MAG: Crp/Fnr family transcriptional regulator [Bacteroidales bacterium]|jgi:CRP-like cAMP-binding protein|nr:Crp/Fnr family transcriptional regulator [Bacteroidales bacterium]